jgi:hypothetical protein
MRDRGTAQMAEHSFHRATDRSIIPLSTATSGVPLLLRYIKWRNEQPRNDADTPKDHRIVGIFRAGYDADIQ